MIYMFRDRIKLRSACFIDSFLYDFKVANCINIWKWFWKIYETLDKYNHLFWVGCELITGCAMVMQSDLDYWGIDELLIESCCSLKYFPQLEICTNEKLGDNQAKRKTEENLEKENFGDSKIGLFRSWLWDTIEGSLQRKKLNIWKSFWSRFQHIYSKFK